MVAQARNALRLSGKKDVSRTGKTVPVEFAETMRRFPERKHLRARTGLSYYSNRGWPYIETDSPVVLARFSAVMRQAVAKKHPDARVFCGGQVRHCGAMRPSLFRPPNDKHSTESLLCAEADFAKELQKASQLRRWNRIGLPALLQHYEIHTSWLDVVDNLYVAVWFATHSRNGEAWTEVSEPGWVYFVSTKNAGCDLRWIDLRDQHHHVSSRVHSQHGVSVTRPTWSKSTLGLEEFVVATVHLQDISRWRLEGEMASERYLFPNRSEDNTLKVLQRKRDLLRQVEQRYKIEGTLGNL